MKKDQILDVTSLTADEIIGVYSLDQCEGAYSFPQNYVQIEKVSDSVVNVYNVKLYMNAEYVLCMKAENVDVSEFFESNSVYLSNEYTGDSDKFYFNSATVIGVENKIGNYFKIEHEGFDISRLSEDYEIIDTEE